jgi:hypothetical protein
VVEDVEGVAEGEEEGGGGGEVEEEEEEEEGEGEAIKAEGVDAEGRGERPAAAGNSEFLAEGGSVPIVRNKSTSETQKLS